MKTYTIIKMTALILALITVSITTAATISCDSGDICVNETGWLRDSGAFNASGSPIHDAVNNASSGDTICVKAGSYSENVDIATAHLTLAGAGADVVNVAAADSGDYVFEVTADYVNIAGFNVAGATGSGNAGICLNKAYHCNISDNTASGNYDGIYLDSSSNNTLLKNTASNNEDNGIELWSSSNNTLTGNTANSNYCDGIYLDSSSNNTLLKNTASNNEGDGIGLYYLSDNTLAGNIANSNYHGGIYLDSSSNNTLLKNTASNNDYDGFDYYGIELCDCDNNLIYNNYFDNAYNAYDDGFNQWNITITAGANIIGGLFIGGNYWGNYTDEDSDGDGLWDTEYPIAGGDNFDYHPLCPPSSVKGDLNGDGILTSADAAIALRLAATGAPDDAADVSGDGQVTSLDALMILQAAAEVVEL
uniref:Cell surface glycoprotein n=1 Tax=Candidatus Methanogaster sp. ANME-2c ERB4 TaxID=2759911 RepID=A0A7G9YG95_9EURY|nr:cell surface glycoprotein [Methanosarcinales archaeon ANME-2c ERB4]